MPSKFPEESEHAPVSRGDQPATSMTIREAFAMAVMQEMVAHAMEWGDTLDEAGITAVKSADALLATLEQQP